MWQRAVGVGLMLLVVSWGQPEGAIITHLQRWKRLGRAERHICSHTWGEGPTFCGTLAAWLLQVPFDAGHGSAIREGCQSMGATQSPLLWQPQSVPDKTAASEGPQVLTAKLLLVPAGRPWRRPLRPSTQPLLPPGQPCCARQLLPPASRQAAVRRWHSCRGSCGKPMNRCWPVVLPADLHCRLACLTALSSCCCLISAPRLQPHGHRTIKPRCIAAWPIPSFPAHSLG